MFIKNVRASLARMIHPTANLPFEGNLPQLQVVSPPAPVAGMPRTTLAELGIKLTPEIMADAIVRHKARGAMRPAVRPVTPPAIRPGPCQPRAVAPAPAADPAPTTDGLDSVIKSILDSVEKLKLMLPADVDADDDGDVAKAKGYLASGDKKAALAAISRAHSAIGAQVAAQKKRSALLSEPSSRSRAHRLTTSGFNSDPAVASLNAALGRGGLSLADRASLALAPAGGTRTPAQSAVTPQPGSRDRAREIQAELKSIDGEFRKSGVYSPAAQARTATLRRELKAELKKFRAS